MKRLTVLAVATMLAVLVSGAIALAAEQTQPQTAEETTSAKADKPSAGTSDKTS